MPKLGEINYIRAIGADGVGHVLNKPFADGNRGRYLADLGLVMGMLPPPPRGARPRGRGGSTTAFLANRGYDVLGRDICPDMIELAERNRDRYDAPSASFEAGDYESMPYRDEFDAALFYDALHHAEDERAALAAAHAALKPGGVCVTVEPGKGHAAASSSAADAFGVTEKDMPPHHVITIGRSVGFREFRVHARFGSDASGIRLAPIGPVCSAGRPGRWRVAVGFARKARARPLALGVREGDGEFLLRTPRALALRTGNIVRMRK